MHTLARLDIEQHMQIQTKRSAAERRVRDIVKLVVEPDSADELAALIKKSEAAKVQPPPNNKSYKLVILDAKLICESGTQSKYRLPPTRMSQLSALIHSAIASGLDAPQLDKGTLFLLPDGGKGKGWETRLRRPSMLPSSSQ